MAAVSYRSVISPRPDCEIALASGLPRSLPQNYRLAPENRFPAALDDAIAAYGGCWSRAEARQRHLAGDSAGGNPFSRQCCPRAERGLPLPISSGVMSPWQSRGDWRELRQPRRSRSDPSASKILALAKNLSRRAGRSLRSRSHRYMPHSQASPLLIQVGARETVLDDSVMLAAKARAAALTLIWKSGTVMIHVFQMFGAELPEAHQAIESIAGFLTGTFTSRREGIIMTSGPPIRANHDDSEFILGAAAALRGMRSFARASAPLRREGGRSAWRAMGARRQDPARDLPPHGSIFGVSACATRPNMAAPIWVRCVDGVGGGAGALDLRRVTSSVLVHTDMSAVQITLRGTPEQKQKYLPRSSAANHLFHRGYEHRCRLRRRRVEDAARRDGDSWVINGSKMFITKRSMRYH